MKVLLADLHIHTCLSPCATLDMTPLKIVRTAKEKKLDLIAITDHNSAENAAAVMAAARDTGLAVIPGMEITTSEEVHILGLFADIVDAQAMQSLVYGQLQPGENDDDLFGIQVVANERDEVEAINRRLLIGATRMHLDQVVQAIHQRNGMALAAHIDREAFSILGQMGFIPDDLDLDALEVSRRTPLKEALQRFGGLGTFPLITSSDAHDLGDIGSSPTAFRMTGPQLTELRRALTGTNGRGIQY